MPFLPQRLHSMSGDSLIAKPHQLLATRSPVLRQPTDVILQVLGPLFVLGVQPADSVRAAPRPLREVDRTLEGGTESRPEQGEGQVRASGLDVKWRCGGGFWRYICPTVCQRVIARGARATLPARPGTPVSGVPG